MKIRRVYIVTSERLPYRFKVGIAYDTDQRRGAYGIATEKRISLPVFDAREVEAAMKRMYQPFSAAKAAKKIVRSGHTEWFWGINVISATLVAMPVGIVYSEVTGALLGAVILAKKYPIDAVFICLLASLIQAGRTIAIIAGAAGAAYYLFTATT